MLEFAKKNGIEFELRNRDDAGVNEELIARGGKRQFPYLVDTENGEEMYESGDLIACLAKQADTTAHEGSGRGTCAVE